MKASRSILYSPRFLLVFTLMSISIIAVSASLPAKQQQDEMFQRLTQLRERFDLDTLKVTNRTAAFNVVGKEKTPEGHVRLSLRNDYNQDITAYSLSLGWNSVTVDAILSMHDAAIKPGQIKDELLPIDLDPDLETRGLIVLAVILEDGTIDGEIESAKVIQDHRIGDEAEMDRIDKILSDDSPVSVASLQSKLDQIKVVAHPDAEENLPQDTKFAIRDARRRVLRLFEDLSNRNNDDIEMKLRGIRDYVKEKKTGLKKYIEAIRSNDR